MFLFPFLCQDQAVFHATTAFQNVWIGGGVVALADDVGGTKLELFGERGSTGPLNIIVVVVGPGVLAAHYVDFVEAFSVSADAF